MTLPISVIVLTKNEEDALEACLSSVSDFAERFVVDSGSTDLTRTVAARNGATVVEFTWNGRYPKKKQWALENTPLTCEFVLLLDADESVTESLKQELYRLLEAGFPFEAAEIPLQYHFDGRTLGHGHRVYKRALLRLGHARFLPVDDLQVTNMWEVEGHYQPCVSGRMIRLAEPLLHRDPDSLYDYFARHNRYSDWEAHLATAPSIGAGVAKERTRQGRIFDRLPAKPAFFFLYSYIVRGGMLDGKAGFNYAVALSFYYWQIGLKRRELSRAAVGRT